MGRFTKIESFSDENTNLVSGYAKANFDENESTNPNLVRDINKSQMRVEVEKMLPISGSCAGAGSSEFDLYRAARKRERERIEQIEKTYEQEKAEKEYQDKIVQNKKEADEKTAKNALKRQKKKEKLQLIKQNKVNIS